MSSASSITAGPRTRKFRQLPYLVAMAPAGVLIGCFFLAPALWAIYVSTTPMSLLGINAGSMEFIGLDNYRRLSGDPDFARYVRNTILFTLGTAIIGASGVGLAVALIIDRAQRAGSHLTSLAFGAVVLAGICPPALAGAVWGGMLDYRTGMLNGVLGEMGIAPVDVLGDFPMMSVIVAETWRNVALTMIVFYGALQTIPRTAYEAASLDGATAWPRLRDITFPAIRQIVALMLLITTIIATGSFLLNQILTGGGTSRQTETLALYAYHVAFVDFEIGFGAAVSVVILLVTGVFAALYVRVASSAK